MMMRMDDGDDDLFGLSSFYNFWGYLPVTTELSRYSPHILYL
jgi:hypothetical protein